MPLELGTGIFTVPQVARLVGEPPAKVRRWLVGTLRAKPALPTRPETAGGEAWLSFRDLVSALFISAFRREGVPLQLIRRVALKAAARHDHDRPFSLRRFGTDGRRLYEFLEESGERFDVPRVVRTDEAAHPNRMLDADSEQVVIRKVFEPYLREIDYGLDDEAQRWWPLGKKRKVVIDPGIALGEPTVRGVPTRVLYGSVVVARERPEQVARWYGLEKPEVFAACEYERKMRARAA